MVHSDYIWRSCYLLPLANSKIINHYMNPVIPSASLILPTASQRTLFAFPLPLPSNSSFQSIFPSPLHNSKLVGQVPRLPQFIPTDLGLCANLSSPEGLQVKFFLFFKKNFNCPHNVYTMVKTNEEGWLYCC